VLLQDYPNLEYIVIDGGSTDTSIATIRHYERWLTYWTSESDRGQADALNKGFERTTGSLLGWVNSDDLLEPGALHRLANAHQSHPSAILLGDVINFDEETGKSWRIRQGNVDFEHMSQPWRYAVTWHQPGTWFTRKLFERVGRFDESLRYVFDWDWMCRALPLAAVHHLNCPLARFRYHARSKTVLEAELWRSEKEAILKRYWPRSIADNPALARAVVEFVAATDMIVYQSSARREAIAHLSRAFISDWRVLRWQRYWVAWLKALLPPAVLHVFRRLMKGF
jgi:glycosyltransferase involved in cell wall biosynthesis